MSSDDVLTTYSARTRLQAERLARSIDALGESWLAFDIGDIALGQAAASDGTFTFPAYYITGGVVIPGLDAAPVVSMSPWTDGAGAVYLFKWDASVHRMVVTDWTGMELAKTTDLSDIVAHPYRAVLSAEPERWPDGVGLVRS